MAVPDELQPVRVPAWETLEAGGSYADAATAADRSSGTISKWVREWRQTYGADLFRSNRQAAANEQTALARQAVEQTWAELRVREARNAGVTASQIRGRLLELLPTVATSRVDRGADGLSLPVVVLGPDARQVKALADASARLLEVAELLDNRPTGHTRRSVPADQWIPAGGLGAGPPESREAKTARVIDLVARLKEKKSG